MKTHTTNDIPRVDSATIFNFMLNDFARGRGKGAGKAHETATKVTF